MQLFLFPFPNSIASIVERYRAEQIVEGFILDQPVLRVSTMFTLSRILSHIFLLFVHMYNVDGLTFYYEQYIGKSLKKKLKSDKYFSKYKDLKILVRGE